MRSHHVALTDERLVEEARRVAALKQDSDPEVASLLTELRQRLSLLAGYRRGLFDSPEVK